MKFAYGTEFVRLAKTRELLRDLYNLGTWAAQWQMGLNADKYILERIIGLKCDYISSLSCLMVSFLNTSFEAVGKTPFVSVREDPDLLSEIRVQPYSLFGKIMQITDSAAAFSFNQMQRFRIFLFAVCYHYSPSHQSLQYHYWVASQWPHSASTHTNSY